MTDLMPLGMQMLGLILILISIAGDGLLIRIFGIILGVIIIISGLLAGGKERKVKT